ncbi:phosphoribosylamine--glycine ligase [Actinomycetaceae bacterium TAE3-ERU4]|nr:phosphoribosylamine--glycine ligase [Actinomycetaceae bacterium TAE3-ERU4]
MIVLLLGSGGREHALARSFSADPEVERLLVVPGNPGTAKIAENVALDPNNAEEMVDIALRERVDLVVVGPEAPLVSGVAQALREAGLAVFGPDRQAAALEGSKAFAKEIMEEAGVPTAQALVCTDEAAVQSALDNFGSPYVVKNDGLAAGKGVVVTLDRQEALDHALSCLSTEGGRVLIEEYLDGPEVSLFCLSDGKTVVPLEPAQDYKRLLDEGQGPNTGGMGAYSPLGWVPNSLAQQVVNEVAKPVVERMAQRGTPFIGLLYCGLALTTSGIRVVEFNVRFGDPETQVILPRLKTPLAQLLLACARGKLAEFGPLSWSKQEAITVVLAAAGYPQAPEKGDLITGIDAAEAVPGVHIIHAGTALNEEEELISAGGRVLCVTALAPTVAAARESAYEALDKIRLEGSHFRTDIGH